MKKLIMGFLLLLPRLILGQNLPTSITTSTALSPETLSIPSISSTANINVVREWAFKVPIELILSNPTKEQALTTTYYTDGLGKPLQEVFYQVSPTGKDLVRPFVYDAYGRSKYGLSPYPSTTNSGKIVQTPGSSYNSRLSTIYSSEANFFERISYENSPVGKVLKNSAPGNSWSGSNKGVTVSERMNTSADYVRKFEIVPGQSSATYLGVYGNDQLFIERMADEDGKISEVFSNFLGQKILSRKAILGSPGTGFSHWLWTYYIYDHKGRLVYTLMPEGANICNSTGNWNVEATTVKEHYFKYFYDSRDRVYQKKLPGADLIEYVYDHLGRVVMERNGQHKSSSEWMVYKYFEKDQPVSIGRVFGTVSRSSYQTNVDNDINYINALSLNSTDQSNGFGHYSIGGTVHTFNSSFNSNFSTNLTASKVLEGRLTGKRKKIDGTGDYLTEVYFYDDRGNMIQRKSINHKGGTDYTTMEYDFSGNLLKSYQVINNPSAGANSTINVLKTYTYDHANRLTAIKQKVNSQLEQTIVTYSYDEIGQLISKNWNDLQTVDYKYNPRGWLTHINDANLSQSGDTFGMQIFYDYGYGTSNLNGNISGVQWKSNRDNVKRSFGYSYDVSNRLLQGYFAAFGTSWDQELDRYSLASTSYDKNGNIKTLTRKGKTSSPSSYSTIDQLTYTYSGNRLTKIEDAISSTLGYSDFKNGASITTEYTYNNAGSTISDANKGITSLTYNFNELPRVIQFGGASNQITNVYDAEGVKLYSTTVTNGVSKRIDYLEGFIYVDNVIQSFAHEEGRSTWDSDNSVFYDEYFYKDHLGNVRQVIRAPVTSGLRATLETESAAEEEKEFGQISETRILDHRHNNTSGGNQVAWLNADRGRVLGPSRVQEVQSGDSLTLEVDVIFDRKRNGFVSPVSSIKSGSNLLFQDHILESVNNFKLAPQINPFLIYSITKLVLADINDRKTPESYLMYALYDQDSVLYEQGKVLVSNAAANNHELLYKTLTVEKNGFIETFVVNETSENVYFDNLRVQSTTPIVVQENHYYPFGMTIAGLDYSYNNHSNKFLYNGKELIEDNGLQYYDYGARMYDPAIGKWGVVDPLADSYQAFSPYNYTLNNPIAFTDPNGMWVEGQNGGMFTDDPDDISKFFQAVGDFFHNLLIPSQTEEGNEKQQATWATVGRVSKTVNDLHDLQKDVLEVAPGGFLGSALMDTQTGNFSGEEFAQNIAYEAGSGFIFGKVIGKAAMGVLKPLGLGSTGRIAAANLTEQLAMEEIISNPSSGKVLIQTMKDASGRWSGWSKMSNRTAHGVEIHYNALWENGVLKAIDDFKFK